MGIGLHPNCITASPAGVGAGPSHGMADAKGSAKKRAYIKEFVIVVNVVADHQTRNVKIEKRERKSGGTPRVYLQFKSISLTQGSSLRAKRNYHAVKYVLINSRDADGQLGLKRPSRLHVDKATASKSAGFETEGFQ